jgi:hypothetical protein
MPSFSASPVPQQPRATAAAEWLAPAAGDLLAATRVCAAGLKTTSYSPFLFFLPFTSSLFLSEIQRKRGAVP